MRLRLIFFVIVLLVPIVNGEELRFFKEEVGNGEVLQLEVNFELIPEEFKVNSIKILTPSNDEINPAVLFSKLDKQKYFISIEIPSDFNYGDYNLILKDVKFLINGSLEMKTFTKKFEVKDKNPSLLILPAHLYGYVPRFHINIRSIKGNNLIEFDVPEFVEHVYSDVQEIEEGKKKKFSFDINKKDFEYFEIRVILNESKYIIPFYNKVKGEIFIPEVIDVEEIEDIKKEGLVFLTNVSVLEREMKRDEILEGPLSFKNIGDEKIDGLEFSLSDELKDVVSINLTGFISLEPGEVKTQFVVINEGLYPRLDEYRGRLMLSNENISIEMPFIIRFKEDRILEEVEESTEEFIEETGISEAGYPKISKPKALGSIFLIIVLIIIGFMIYILTRKTKEKTLFKDYVKQIKK